MKREMVVAVIVTFNRRELLIKNIKMLQFQTYQLDKIIIIDNHGVDNTKEYLVSNNIDMDQIEYVYLDENIGGAGGFYEGVKRAHKEGFDWIILMDDDGKPYNNDTIKNIFKEIKMKKLDSDNPVFLNSLVVCDDSKLSFGFKNIFTINEAKRIQKDGVIPNLVNPFNETIISKGLVEKIGYPNKDFFIRWDEVEYEMRAKKISNVYIATVVNSLYYHPTIKNENLKKIVLGNKKVYLGVDCAWKTYYSARNLTFICKRDKKRWMFIKYIIVQFMAVLVCKCNKKQLIGVIIKGIRDGMKGNMGKTVLPS